MCSTEQQKFDAYLEKKCRECNKEEPKDTSCNGYSNYNTWCINLWLNENPCEYDILCSICNSDKSEYDKVDLLKALIYNNIPVEVTGMYRDLLISAIQEADFYEIISANTIADDDEPEEDLDDEDQYICKDNNSVCGNGNDPKCFVCESQSIKIEEIDDPCEYCTNDCTGCEHEDVPVKDYDNRVFGNTSTINDVINGVMEK